jgi:hypothetical protein
MLLTSIARCSLDPGTSQPLLGFSSGPFGSQRSSSDSAPPFPTLELRLEGKRRDTLLAEAPVHVHGDDRK